MKKQKLFKYEIILKLFLINNYILNLNFKNYIKKIN